MLRLEATKVKVVSFCVCFGVFGGVVAREIDKLVFFQRAMSTDYSCHIRGELFSRLVALEI